MPFPAQNRSEQVIFVLTRRNRMIWASSMPLLTGNGLSVLPTTILKNGENTSTSTYTNDKH